MNFGLLEMFVAFLLGLFIGGCFGLISCALCAIQREESFKRYEEDSFE